MTRPILVLEHEEDQGLVGLVTLERALVAEQIQNVERRADVSQGRRTRYLPRDWDRRRKRILRRDQGICYVCGGIGAEEVDHIVPVSRGGDSFPSSR